MKKLPVLVACVLFAVANVFSQQTIISENVDSFNSVSFSGNITAELIKSDAAKIEIVLSEVDITKLKWIVKNGVLSVTLNSGSKGKGHADVKVYYAESLASVSVSGSEFTSAEPITGDFFHFSANGGSRVTLEFDVLDLTASISGNSAALFSGEVKYLAISASEKSKVDARDMECLSAEVDASTGAEIYVTVTERLVANAKTSSTIFYKGKPTVLRDKTSRMSSGMFGSSILNIGD
ncbi:MAG: DUF2807 domain-containing protein [Rikenellaceae bacterium]|nr:DUF2807 domain-containing protein [Rikenellaceae bacterium]